MKKSDLKISITLNSRLDFFSKYNVNSLSLELKDYIMNELVGYNPNSKLTLLIDCLYDISEEDINNYESALRKEFRETIIETKHEAKLDLFRNLLLLVVGLFLIIFSNYLGGIYKEFVLVFGWFSLGQVAYTMFFTVTIRRRKLKRFKQILISNIKFK